MKNIHCITFILSLGLLTLWGCTEDSFTSLDEEQSTVLLKKKPGSVPTLYDVYFEGLIEPASKDTFEGVEGPSRRLNIHVRQQDLFLELDSLNGFDTLDCFKGIDLFERQPGMDISMEKDTTKARIFHFFSGYGTEGPAEVKYLLVMYGEIIGDWRPNEFETTQVILKSWEMRPENKRVKNACTGSGNFDDGEKEMIIKVKRRPLS